MFEKEAPLRLTPGKSISMLFNFISNLSLILINETVLFLGPSCNNCKKLC
jgi:hypothetical protein